MLDTLERSVRGHGVRWFHLLALAAVCALPFVRGTVLVTAPYGDSHDGRNGSVWAEGAESLREDPIGSRLGAERGDGRIYANHPPAILTTLAAAEAVAGDRPATDRTVVLAATIAAIVLSFALLLACGFRPTTALLGVAAMALTPMVRAYGSMVDTPMLAFPFAVALVLMAVRLDSRDRVRWWELGLVGVAPLLSWQLLLLDGLIVIGIALDRGRRRHLLPVISAAIAGSALTAMWLIWANGGAAPVIDQWLARSSVDSDVGFRTALDTQSYAARQLLGPAVLAVPLTVVLMFEGGRRRWAASLSTGVVLLYILLLPNGAAFHDYWSYWVLLPVALGTAALLDVLDRALRARSYPSPMRLTALAVVFAGLTLPGIVRPSLIEDVNVSSAAVSDVIAGAELSPGQDQLWALAEFRLGDTWLEELDVPVAHLTEAKYRDLVTDGRGDHAVIVSTSCTLDFIACRRIPLPVEEYRDRRFRIVRIDDLAAQRPGSP